MTAYQYSGRANRRLLITTFIVSLGILSVAIGFAYSKGLFGGKTPTIDEPLQITLSSDRLDFGLVPLHGSATRQLVVRNDSEDPLRARIVADGPQYRVSPEQLILHPGINSRVAVAVIGEQVGDLDNGLEILIEGDKRAPLTVALAARVQANLPPANGRAGLQTESLSAADGRGPQGVRAAHGRHGASARQNDMSQAGDGSFTTAVVQVAEARLRSSEESPHGGTATAATGEAARAQSRRPGSSKSESDRSQTDRNSANRGLKHPGMGVTVRPYDPATSAPYRSLAEKALPVSETISEREAQNAGKVQSKIPGEGLPETLPETPGADDDDLFDDDVFDDDDDDQNPDPFNRPALTISGQSTVRLMGSLATFYPQEIGVVGTNMGGQISLIESLRFPQIPLAFGESMLFSQVAGVAVGGFDPQSGEVQLQLPLQVIDSDGDAAPLSVLLTTGTVMARNQAGIVVSMSGTPRMSTTGIMRLVAIEKIPVGFRNGAEEHLAVFEILGSLTFGDSPAGPSKSAFGRIGG